MLAVQNFAFEENLVRVILREEAPWFFGADACRALGIKNSRDALARLDDDEKGVANGDTLGGEQTMIVVSEPGLYRLIFTSRVPSAERFKRWLAHDVLPALRRTGRFDGRPGLLPLEGAARAEIPEGFLAKLYCVRECRFIHGAAVARLMWNKLGLPPVPPPPLTAQDEARQCLRHLLDAPVHAEGPAIRECLEGALDEGEEERGLLLAAGIRVYPDRDGFVVANQGPWLREVFHGTEWALSYARVLRRLPGTAAAGTSRFQGINRRGTFLPADLLDEG